MVKKVLSVLLVVIVVYSFLTPSRPLGLCGDAVQGVKNFEASYKFSVQSGCDLGEHSLYVSLPPSVLDYYAGKGHLIRGQLDYARFVTPSAVQSVAENIRSVTRETPYDDEEFANSVLTIVRQIPYLKSDAKYPVETLVSNEADCDGLSILAASLMKAGGLDAVLLLYENMNPPHMNVGVSLEEVPVSRSWWTAPVGVEYGNETYWVAECTSMAEWNVGDRPKLLESVEPEVIPLENCEKASTAQVSSSLDRPLEPSSISVRLSSGYSEGDVRVINVSGSVSPPLSNETVTLYVNQLGYAATPYGGVVDEAGNYTVTWNVSLPGTYVMKVSWSGRGNFSGSDSEEITVFVGAQRPVIRESSNGVVAIQVCQTLIDQYSPWYMALLNQRVCREVFRRNLTGSELVFSGDFMVLSDGREIQLDKTTFTVPAHSVTYRLPRSSRVVTIRVPEEVVAIPGVELLSSQFGFSVRQIEEGNYTAAVKVLDGADVSAIARSVNENRSVFVNASNLAEKETWYRATARLSLDSASVEVCDENGTRLDGASQKRSGLSVSEFGVLMYYQTGQILAFKNLKVEAISRTRETAGSTPVLADEIVPTSGLEFLFPYVRGLLLLAGTILAFGGLWRRRKRGDRSVEVHV